MPNKMPRDAYTQGGAEAFDQDLVREATVGLLGQGSDDLAQQGVLQRIQIFKPGCCRFEFRQQGGIQIGVPDRLHEPPCRVNTPDRDASRAETQRARRGGRQFPSLFVLYLDERGWHLIQRENEPVAVTSPYGFTATPVVAHCRYRGPGFNSRDLRF